MPIPICPVMVNTPEGDVVALPFTHTLPLTVALLVVEELFFAKSTTTAMKVAEVRGVILLLAGEASMEVVEVKPNEVKMATTGYGRADKRQMQQMVKVIFGG